MSSRVVLTDVLCSSTAAVSVTPRFSEVSSVHSILLTVSTVSNMKAVETAIIYLTHRLAAFVWIGLMFVFFPSPCGLRVDWSYVRVFSWFACR